MTETVRRTAITDQFLKELYGNSRAVTVHPQSAYVEQAKRLYAGKGLRARERGLTLSRLTLVSPQVPVRIR